MPAPESLPAPPRRLDAMFTPGQRWSTAVIGFLGLALAFAQTTAPVGFAGFDSPAASGPLATVGGADSPAAPVAQPTLDAAPVVDPSAGSAEGSTTGDPGPPPVPPDPPKVVALVRTGDGSAPGRDDAAIAAVFLETAAFPATVMPLPAAPDAAFCAKVGGAGPVAVTGLGLDAPFRDCLLRAGVLLVGFDTLGEASAGAGGVVSTRRGVEPALDDLTVWARRSGALAGKVGVVGTTPARPAVEAAVGRMRAAGVDVAATAFVADGDAVDAGVSEGVRAFASAGVGVVVLAAPVAQQRQWAAQQGVVTPAVRYVVADAYDAVYDESYPATFDGALAHTALRIPWFARDNGETPAQRDCRSRWEAKAAPPITLDSREQAKVFAWCQHVALVGAALDTFTAGATTFADALRRIRFSSPLTSDVGPLAGGRYGPTQVAVLVWQASCSCWKQKEPYADRG